jgi:hypothetical protein
MKAVIYWLKHPGLSLFAGVVLLAAGVAETIEGFATGYAGLAAEHGIVVFGLITCLKAVAEILEGLVKIEDAAAEAGG